MWAGVLWRGQGQSPRPSGFPCPPWCPISGLLAASPLSCASSELRSQLLPQPQPWPGRECLGHHSDEHFSSSTSRSSRIPTFSSPVAGIHHLSSSHCCLLCTRAGNQRQILVFQAFHASLSCSFQGTAPSPAAVPSQAPQGHLLLVVMTTPATLVVTLPAPKSRNCPLGNTLHGNGIPSRNDHQTQRWCKGISSPSRDVPSPALG